MKKGKRYLYRAQEGIYNPLVMDIDLLSMENHQNLVEAEGDFLIITSALSYQPSAGTAFLSTTLAQILKSCTLSV